MAAPRFVGPFPGGARLADSQRSAVTKTGAVDVGVQVLVWARVFILSGTPDWDCRSWGGCLFSVVFCKQL